MIEEDHSEVRYTARPAACLLSGALVWAMHI